MAMSADAAASAPAVASSVVLVTTFVPLPDDLSWIASRGATRYCGYQQLSASWIPVTYRKLGRATPPSLCQGTDVASSIGAGVGTVGVDNRIGPNNRYAGWIPQWKRVVGVFEKNDGISRYRAGDVCMVSGYIDAGLSTVSRVEGHRWITLVLLEEVPRSENAGDHVVDTGLRNGAIGDGLCEVFIPVDTAGWLTEVTAGHSHVQAGIRTGDGAMLRVPVTHDISTEPQFLLQQSIQNALVLARPGAVDLVVGAHHGGDVGLDSVVERPEIDFVHGAIIHVRAYRLAAVFLFVEDVMLYAVRICILARPN